MQLLIFCMFSKYLYLNSNTNVKTMNCLILYDQKCFMFCQHHRKHLPQMYIIFNDWSCIMWTNYLSLVYWWSISYIIIKQFWYSKDDIMYIEPTKTVSSKMSSWIFSFWTYTSILCNSWYATKLQKKITKAISLLAR